MPRGGKWGVTWWGSAVQEAISEGTVPQEPPRPKRHALNSWLYIAFEHKGGAYEGPSLWAGGV